jgi:hypothetical protein
VLFLIVNVMVCFSSAKPRVRQSQRRNTAITIPHNTKPPIYITVNSCGSEMPRISEKHS